MGGVKPGGLLDNRGLGNNKKDRSLGQYERGTRKVPPYPGTPCEFPTTRLPAAPVPACLIRPSHPSVSPARSPVLWNYQHGSSVGSDDNFVDPHSFLERLTVGAPAVKSWRDTVLGALHVSNHVCLVAGLVGTWVSFATRDNDTAASRRLDIMRLFAFEAASFLFTLLLHSYIASTGRRRRKLSRSKLADEPEVDLRDHLAAGPSSVFLHGIWQAVVLTVTVALLSPIYATLTTSISSDTTIALIVVLMIVHLYLYDYREGSTSPSHGSSSLRSTTRSTTYATSLICGMSASVLASTTMPSIIDVIGVTLLALQLYIGSPYFLHGMYGAIGKAWTSVLVTLCVLVVLPLVLKVWLSALLVVIVLLCPMWMLRIDKYKSHISGPWDEVAPSFDDAPVLRSNT